MCNIESWLGKDCKIGLEGTECPRLRCLKSVYSRLWSDVRVCLQAKEGLAAAPEQGGSRQTIAGEVKSGTGYESTKGDTPDIRPPGLTDKAVANSTPTKERTGEGVKRSSKF